MIVIILRTFIIFLTLMVVMRLMGKRQIGEMQPFEFIVTLIIADLACIPMADVSIPLIYGIVAILTLFFLHQLLSLIEQTGGIPKKIISGKPSIVINKDGIDLVELKKNNMGVEDLIESMRALGYFSLDDLDYAIFESNGKLSPMESNRQKDTPSSMPLLIISDGKTQKTNLERIGFDEDKLNDYVKSNGGTIKNTEVMTMDGNGRVYFKIKKQPYRILNATIEGGLRW